MLGRVLLVVTQLSKRCQFSDEVRVLPNEDGHELFDGKDGDRWQDAKYRTSGLGLE
jgi:hypothetical protein